MNFAIFFLLKGGLEQTVKTGETESKETMGRMAKTDKLVSLVKLKSDDEQNRPNWKFIFGEF